ncbi:MAG: hypothetical protein HZB70_00160 [Candidatus Berkelbacteria bacterium]|nr:MAG: hypothetical protein HZB70_00160 [Candidatus Berkelbacteria bacterium]QQG51474.1 MAG: hypothetical protein HY845_02840 [Candidatus Berkelbacteria bacterium]
MQPGRSYLVNYLDPSEPRFALWSKIDQTWVEADTLGVKEARHLIAQASLQPFGDARLMAIRHADALSEAVQNTLLKLLEEPPLFLTVILEVVNPASLLPTIQSRLHRLDSAIRETDLEPEKLFTDYREARAVLEQVKDRSKLEKLLIKMLSTAKTQLTDLPNKSKVLQVNLLDRAIRRLRQNANQKLVIDSFLLNWPFNSSTSES